MSRQRRFAQPFLGKALRYVRRCLHRIVVKKLFASRQRSTISAFITLLMLLGFSILYNNLPDEHHDSRRLLENKKTSGDPVAEKKKVQPVAPPIRLEKRVKEGDGEATRDKRVRRIEENGEEIGRDGSKIEIQTFTNFSNSLNYWADTDIRMERVYDEIEFKMLPTYDSFKLGFRVAYDRRKVIEEELPLEVIVMPHSQHDPGWLQTFEEYYFNTSSDILSSAHEYLGREADVSFELAEICFLELWWRNHGAGEREALKRVIANGQMEILTGGWVVPDEANTHYYALIMQLLEGHEWLRNHLSADVPPPTTHWNIDTFGLSPTIAYLLRASGIRQGIVQRAHYAVKSYLGKRRQLEFHWRQSWAGASAHTDFLTHMMPLYATHITESCGVDPYICCQFDFARIGCKCPENWKGIIEEIRPDNLAERADMLAEQFWKKAQLYRTGTGNNRVVFVPWGEDRRYASVGEWQAQHGNLRRLFDHINSRPEEYNINVRFGTAKHYFDRVRERFPQAEARDGEASNTSNAMLGGKKEAEKHLLPSLSGDFFTYADKQDHYWGGYYTSRPFHKHLDRTLQHYLRTADILYTAAMTNTQLRSDATRVDSNINGYQRKKSTLAALSALYPYLVEARRALAIFQHHDAVTGTSTDYVMEDYAKKMLAGINASMMIITRSTEVLLNLGGAINKAEAAEEGLYGRQSVGASPASNHRTESQIFMSYTNHDGFPLAVAENYAGVELSLPRVIPPESWLVLFNPLGSEREEMVCIYIEAPTGQIKEKGKVLNKQLLIHECVARGDEKYCSQEDNWTPFCQQQLQPVVELREERMTIVNNRRQLCFIARLPPLGFHRYYLKYSCEENGSWMKNCPKRAESAQVKLHFHGDVDLGNAAHSFIMEKIEHLEGLPSSAMLSFSNNRTSLGFDSTSGLLKQLTSVRGEKEELHTQPHSSLDIELSFAVYKQRQKGITSGAYFFMPKGKAEPITTPAFGNPYVLIDGPLRKSMVVKLNGVPHGGQLLHAIELDANSDAPTIRNLIDLSHSTKDAEVVMRLTTNTTTAKMPDFYTELNAYQFIRRHRHLDKLPLHAHIFPMPGSVLMQGSRYRLSLLGRQALGVLSLESGLVEVVLDRRLTTDALSTHKFGVQDNRPTESRFRLVVEEFSEMENAEGKQWKSEQQSEANTAYHSLKAYHASLQLQYPVVVQFMQKRRSSPPTSTEPVVRSLLAGTLPCDVHLVALRTLSNATGYDPAVVPSNVTLVDFTSLPTLPQRAAVLILHRVGVECSLLGELPQWCPPMEVNKAGGISLDSIFSTRDAVLLSHPKRVAEALLTLLKVAALGEKGGNVSELLIGPMELRSWQLEF